MVLRTAQHLLKGNSVMQIPRFMPGEETLI